MHCIWRKIWHVFKCYFKIWYCICKCLQKNSIYIRQWKGFPILYPEIKVLFLSIRLCLRDLWKSCCILIFLKKKQKNKTRLQKNRMIFLFVSILFENEFWWNITNAFKTHTLSKRRRLFCLSLYPSLNFLLYIQLETHSISWQYHVAFLCLTNKSYTYILCIYTSMFSQIQPNVVESHIFLV